MLIYDGPPLQRRDSMRVPTMGSRFAEHGIVAVGRAILPAVGRTHDALSLDDA